ncbi:MAG: SIS domain-containing protein [Chloroflexi bacterium]|nr:SIS domain-containing protein [Chloroflexota bacterium]
MIENSHLYREIHEQPDAVARVLNKNRQVTAELAGAVRARRVEYIVIAARGTSDNAARYAQYLFGAHNRLPVALATPSLFTIYKRPPRLKNALVLGISQSGKSPDIVAVLAEAQRQGALTAAITNDPDSDLAQAAAYVLPLHAGEERAVAATKTYTTELAAIALLSALLGNDENRHQELMQMPERMAQVFEIEQDIPRVAERYRFLSACVTIGRGYNYATAFELALKLKELTYTVVEPYSSADFLHGPLALVQHGFPIIVIAPSGQMLPEMLDFIATVKRREAELLVISDAEAALSRARIGLRLPAGAAEWLSPLITIIPGQLLSMYLAATRDYDVDHPRGIRKVTETI